jgi:beta-1,4-N-acetylglucosaminyltransferase
MTWWGYLMWVFVTGIVSRLVTVWILTGYPMPLSMDKKKQRSLKTLAVLGSGGHTAEILNVVRALNFERYQPRCYIAAVTDNHSLSKAQRVEEMSENAGKNGYQQPTFYRIYRSREVGQSYLTSIGTTLLAIAHAFWLVIRIRPDVILCNGPGTCLPICIAGFFLKVVGVKWVVMVYIESIARVQKLSLTGLLFYRLHLMDKFIVQWPKLQENFPGTEYMGQLM